VEIADQRTGEIHDYTHKGGVESAELVLPQGAPEWAAGRVALWNAAEQAETRKNSTVAREFEIALPSELSAEERKRLAMDFARQIVTRHQCAADVAIHAPGKEGDNRNHHAHILLTTRRLTPDGFTEKTRELDDVKQGEVTRWRERYARLQNERLRAAGLAVQVDHRSLEAQGVDREPTRHLGPAATGYERRTGEPSRKRLMHRDETLERLARAREAGELERQGQATDRTILDLSGDLAAAKAARERQPAPEVKQAAAAVVADFRAQFEAHKLAEQGKQQAREAYERHKAAELARQQAAELARQQAAEKAAQELARQREEAEIERKQPKKERGNDGLNWSR
jgi:ATP-dependent exoDNAse (exonuclease V) alpha subunit